MRTMIPLNRLHLVQINLFLQYQHLNIHKIDEANSIKNSFVWLLPIWDYERIFYREPHHLHEQAQIPKACSDSILTTEWNNNNNDPMSGLSMQIFMLRIFYSSL